MERHKVYIEYW